MITRLPVIICHTDEAGALQETVVVLSNVDLTDSIDVIHAVNTQTAFRSNRGNFAVFAAGGQSLATSSYLKGDI